MPSREAPGNLPHFDAAPDLVGLDVRLAILEHLHRELGEQFRPPAILRQMVRAGRLGKKVGLGFYRWTDDGPQPTE